MPKILKIKIDGTVSGREIPTDVEELELDCKAVAARAFENRRRLISVKLINTETIGREAFRNCKHLIKAELPETLREIGSRAFRDTDLRRLIIPKGVAKLGTGVILGSGNSSPILEIYSEEGEAPLFFDSSFHLAEKTRLIVRSPKTDEILYQFPVFNCLEDVLTWHGPDFSRYDQMILDSLDSDNPRTEAARMRVKYPINLSGGVLEIFKDHVSEKTAETLKKTVAFPMLLDYFYGYEDLKLNTILELIPYFENIKRVEVTEELKGTLNIKIGGDMKEISSKELAEAAEASARLGMTELTAVLMDELHKRGGGNAPDLEL